jgi:hypothetical protein
MGQWRDTVLGRQSHTPIPSRGYPVLVLVVPDEHGTSCDDNDTSHNTTNDWPNVCTRSGGIRLL